jgi:hypothetical protein
MRHSIIAAATAAAISLAGCGNNDQVDNTQNVDENLSAENIVSNDVTAIDAVTADAANMAADVNYIAPIDNAADNAAGNASNSDKPAARPKPKAAAPGSDAPSGNTAASAPANTTE